MTDGYFLCGNCKHWHEREEQKYNLKIGDCDKIPKGTPFGKFEFDGTAFEDENYDEEFDCFDVMANDKGVSEE